MSFGFKVKNEKGEILVDGLKGIPKILGWDKRVYSAYSYSSLTSNTDIPNPVFFFQITGAYASPAGRKVDNTHQEIYNRFALTQTPNPTIKAMVSNIGVSGDEDIGQYGIKVFGEKSNEIVTEFGTLQIFKVTAYATSWAQRVGAFNGWVCGPVGLSFTAMKEEPFVICNPLVYRSFYQAANNQQRLTALYQATKSSLYFGVYLYQTAQWTLAAQSTYSTCFYICQYKGEY